MEPNSQKPDIKYAFQEGKFDYTECFTGKYSCTDRSVNETLAKDDICFGALAKSLASQKFLFGLDSQITWLEPGIGPGTSSLGYFQQLLEVHKPGVRLHISDIREEYLEQAAECFQNYFKGKPLEVVESKRVDAFLGEKLTDTKCDIAMFSHLCYYAEQEGINNLVRVAKDSLKERGFIVALHESPTSDFAKYQYCFPQDKAPGMLAQASVLYGMQIASVKFPGRWYFPDLPQETLARFEDLGNWKDYEPYSMEGGWLRGYLFATHLDLVPELSAKGELPKAVREFLSMLKRDEWGVYISYDIDLQVIFKNAEDRGVFESACNDIKNQMPELDKKSREMRLAAAST